MTATIHQFPTRLYQSEPAQDKSRQVTTVAQLVVNIKSRFMHKLNDNQKHILSCAEQLSMQGYYAETQHRYLADLYIKLGRDSFTHRFKKWFGRNLRKAKQP